MLSLSSLHSCNITTPSNSKLQCAIRVTAGADDRKKNQIHIPDGLDPNLMPKHVAAVLNGNSKWAENRGLPLQLGHLAGVRATKQLALNCSKFGVHVLTVFVMSNENWTRPKEEVDFLMRLFEETIHSEIDELMSMRIHVCYKRKLPKCVQNLICYYKERAKANNGRRRLVTTTLNYRDGEFAKKVKGDHVLFVDNIFPDFDETDFVKAVKAFQHRHNNII